MANSIATAILLWSSNRGQVSKSVNPLRPTAHAQKSLSRLSQSSVWVCLVLVATLNFDRDMDKLLVLAE
jgi:hypothetical protein